MADEKGKKDSGDRNGGNGGKERRGDREVIKRPGDNVHGNNNNTSSTGPRSPRNEKK